VWSYDFVKGMTHDGRALRILVLIDEYTRECLVLRVARRLGSMQVIEALYKRSVRSPGFRWFEEKE
jgi:putative transposase